MSRVLIIVLALVIVGCAWAAPADEAAVVEKEVTADKKTTPVDKGVVVSEAGSWDVLFSGNNAWSIVTGGVATIFILAGLGLGFYYFYWLSYNGQQPEGQPFAQQGYNPTSGFYSGYSGPAAYNYQAAARALNSGSNFSWTRVLDMIAMAQETYEKFDFQSLDCQKKALCELQQKHTDFGETGRKISSSFSFMDALDGLPMPTMIQTYLKEYKEAILQGKNSTKDCAAVYPKCQFSIKEIFVKYTKKSHKL